MGLRPHALTAIDAAPGEIATARSSRAAVVGLDRVTKSRFGELVLDGVSVEIPGGVTVIVGANGAGKTTLLQLITGDLAPDAGAIRVGARSIGVVEERLSLPAGTAPAELIRHVAEVHGARRSAARRQAQQALDDVGIGEERLRRIGTLSVGVQRRVSLAAAIAHRPDLLILDEPANGLDARERRRFFALVSSLAAAGLDVIVTAHDRGDVAGVEDAALFLGGGRIVSGEAIVRRHLVVTCRGATDGAVRELRAAGLRPRVAGTTIRLPDTLKAREALHRSLLRSETAVVGIDVDAAP